MKPWARGCVAIFAVGWFAASAQEPPMVPEEFRPFQGLWMVYAIDPPSEKVDRAKFYFQNDAFIRLMEKVNTTVPKYRVRNFDETQLCRETLRAQVVLGSIPDPADPDKSRKTITYMIRNAPVVKGLYEFQGNESLKMCLAPANFNMPDAFAANPENRQVVITLTKVNDMKFRP